MIGIAVLVLLQFIVEQPFLTINALGLCRQGQCHHFQIRKLGNRTTTWNITRFIDEIFRELFAYLKYFDEFCIKLFIRWFELNVLNTTELLKISDMYDFLLITINLN